MTAYQDTILIDGHDVRGITGIEIGPGHMTLFAPGDRRGDDQVVFGDDGELAAPLPLAKWIVRIPIRVLGTTRGERNDNLIACGVLIGGFGNRGRVSLERRIATGSGSSHNAHFAPGRFITGLSPALLNHRTGRTELQYYQTQAYWLASDGTTKVYT